MMHLTRSIVLIVLIGIDGSAAGADQSPEGFAGYHTLSPVIVIGTRLDATPYITRNGITVLPEKDLVWRVSDGPQTLYVSLIDQARNREPVSIELIPTDARRLVRDLTRVVELKKSHTQAGVRRAQALGAIARRSVHGLRCVINTARYEDTEAGITEVLFGHTVKVRDSYQFTSRNGQNRVEDCVLMVLDDNGHWPFVAKMDLTVTAQLIDELAAVIADINDTNARHGNLVDEASTSNVSR
jgi:hypothetical protein